MREIIFKALIKREKRIKRIWKIDYMEDKICTGNSNWYDFDEIEFIPSIGLKEKNGIELYDGYILKDNEGRLFVIEYKFGGFNLVPLSSSLNCLNDEFSWNPLGDMQTAAFVEESCEVIGNIYQNPELLEKQ